jgi:hypothetical protein
VPQRPAPVPPEVFVAPPVFSVKKIASRKTSDLLA